MTEVPPVARSAVLAGPERVAGWLTLLGCLGLVAVTYLPTALRAEFLNFDDNFFFGPDNPEFRAGWVAVLDPRQTIANVYLPVSHLSLWLDWKLFGGAPLGPHLVSLLLHALAGFALVRAFVALRIAAVPAHLAGALFLLHPALCESVLWVSSRKDLLAGLFVFVALGATARFAAAPGRGRLCWIAALSVLAMYSKATAVVLPLLLLLVVLFTGGSRRRFLAPLVSLAVTLPIAWHHQLLAAAEGTMAGALRPLGERLLQVPGVFLHYLVTSLVPRDLNVLYPEVQTLAAFRADFWPGLVVVVALLLVVGVLWRVTALRAAGLGLLLALLALLPFNTAFPASSIAAADRYLYLALPGVALAVATALPALLRPRPGLVLCALLVAPLWWLGSQRAPAFASSEALWQSSLAVEPDNAVAHTNLVADLQVRRPSELAAMQRHLEAAAASARYPVHALRAQLALLRLHQQQGEVAAAADAAEAAVAAAEGLLAAETVPLRQQQAKAQLLPTLLTAFEPLRQGHRQAAAQRCWQRARELAPDLPAVLAFEAQLLLGEFQGQDAAKVAADPRVTAIVARLEQAVQQAEYDHDLCLALGLWLAMQDQTLQAIRYLGRARAVEAIVALSRSTLAPAAIAATVGLPVPVVEGVLRDPQHRWRLGSVEAHVHYAALCRQKGMLASAEQAAAEGLSLYPHADPRLRQEKALALAGQGHLDQAIGELEAYMATAPDDHNAARALSSFLCGKAIAGMNEKPRAELEDLLARALHWRPDEPRVDIVRGKLCRDQRRFQDAIDHLERAHAAFPELADVTSLLAQSYFDLGYQKRFARPKDDDGAVVAFRRFLAIAPPEQDTAGVKLQLEGMWKAAEREGVEKLKQGDRASAAACFRRCLAIDPDQHWAAWLLATALFDQPGADAQELERLLRQAVQWQERHQLDPSRQLVLLVLVLQRGGNTAAAKQVAGEHLPRLPQDADAEAVRLLRSLLGQ